MECQLATHFSCHCPKCVDGATNYLNYCYSTSSSNSNDNQTSNNDNNDSFVLPYYTSSSVSSCDINNNNNNSSSSCEQNDDDETTISFPQTTTTSSTFISSSCEEEEEEQDSVVDEKEHHRYLKRLAKNKKWEKKLRRLQFLERASFTPGTFTRTYTNPRRDYNEFGVEYYEIFELDRPKSLAPRVLHATETGIFYPKRSETLRYLARKNYSVRGIGCSLFTREGQCPEAVRLCRPFDNVGKYDDKAGHCAKFDERGFKNLEQKHLHYKKDRRLWLKKQAARKQQEQESTSSYENEDEEQEEEEEPEASDNIDEWDDSLIGWMWAGKNNNKNGNNKKFQQRKNFKKGGKFNLWEDDFENYHHW